MLFLSAGVASAQLTRIDSIVARAAVDLLLPYAGMHITFDTSLKPLSTFVSSTPSGEQLHLTQLRATLDTSATPALIAIGLDAQASHSETRHWSSTVQLPGLDIPALARETIRSRFVKLSVDPAQESSIWSDVLEPALVVIGSGAIVALFFLIRS